MTLQEKESLRCYQGYILKILNPTYVMCYMKDWLTDDTVEKIESKVEKKGVTAGAELFLESLVELTSEGWFRGFLDALHAAGYEGLYEAIENWDFKLIENLEQHRMLLKRIEPSLRNIDPLQVLDRLSKCLMDRDIEEIRQVTVNKGTGAGALKLLDCLCRSDKEHWPKTFQMALEWADYENESKLWYFKEDVEMIDDTDIEMVDAVSGIVDIQLQYSEEAESDDLSGSQPPLSATYQPSVYVPKKARSYQEELAKPALGGKHTIICAPTGSGKTFVSVMICDHHLRNMPAGQKGKMVFLATKVPVYEQQKTVFQEHFKKSSYIVGGMCGGTYADAPMAELIEESDIIVLTPQILVNCLNDQTVQSLSVFTLMIFDECHNTTGNHPYNVLMSKYLDLKFDHPEVPLPQIIGLTASLGVGNAKTHLDTVNHICKLCASLNAECISTVRKNIQELAEVICKPQKIIKLVDKRPKSDFVDIISNMMAKAEHLASNLNAIDDFSSKKRKTYGTQMYEQWIISIQKKCRVLKLPDKEEESKICRALFIYTEHLRKYNDALIIHEDARTQDALAYLKEFFENIRSGGFDEIELQLASNFEDKLPELTATAEDEFNENPKLEEITFILGEEYRANPQTRTLLFVKTRALTVALRKWIEENSRLRHLKPDVLMGRGNRNHKTGMTLPVQKSVLESFRMDGKSKILIATSVADEGIDIASCNLVLLYEYTGNVIKMIQVRGRGRAKDSKCYLVTSKREQAENEKLNMWKEQMMNVAIADIQMWDEKTFMQKINEFQKILKRTQDSKKNEPQGKKLSDTQRRLLCGKCKAFACDTEQIRVIEGAHHTVLGEDFRKRYQTEPHSRPSCYGNFQKRCKLYCNADKCKHDWGITVKYSTFDNLPLIKIESFSVEDVATGRQLCFKKWRDTNFALKEFKMEEMPE